MSDEDLNGDPEGSQESGSALRAERDRVAGENKTLREELAQFRAKEVLSAGNYDLVEVDDLAKVDGDLTETAQKIQEDRQSLVEKLLRKRFEQDGLSGDDLDAAVSAIVTADQNPTDERLDSASRAGSFRAVGGKVPPIVDPATLSPMDKLRQAEREAQGKRSRRSGN